jgi:hypothetical protein
MSLIKSNSALVAIDQSYISNTNKFKYFQFLQSLSIDFQTNRINSKHIGQSTYLVNQFSQPEVVLDLTFLQTNHFFNERNLGFNLSYSDVENEYVFKNIVKDNFYNKNLFILFNEINNNDLIYSNINQTMTSMSIGNLYLNNYSISYKIKELPIVTAQFAASEFKVEKISSLNKLKNWDNSEIILNEDISDEVQFSSVDHLVYVMASLSSSSDFLNKSYSPGISVNALTDSIITSFDASFELNRNKLYFFNKTNAVSNRDIILPINGKLKISGQSYNLNVGSIKDFFQSNSSFYIQIDALDNLKEIISSFIYENITIDSFSYSININGFLEYSLDCSFQITDKSGFKIKRLQDTLIYADKIKSSNGDFIITLDNYNLYAVKD